jgi:large subunit ribosomal protein L29
MPLIRVKEIRDMSTEDRSKRLGELRTELLRLRTMIRAGGTVENPARVKEIRKAIAKILTIEHEETLGIRGAKKKTKEKPKAKPKPERKKEK